MRNLIPLNVVLILALVATAACSNPFGFGKDGDDWEPEFPTQEFLEIEYTDLGSLGGGSTGATDINDSTQVVGWSTTGNGYEVHAFLWQDDVMTDLGTLGGPRSEALAINDHGDIVGFSSTSYDPISESHAFLWSNGEMIDLGTLGGSGSRANDINNAGQIVGSSSWSSTDWRPHAFLWEGGTMIDIGDYEGVSTWAIAINNTGQIVGNLQDYQSANHNQVVAWSGDGPYTIVARNFWFLEVVDINDLGDILVRKHKRVHTISDYVTEVRWGPNSNYLPPLPGDDFAVGNAINNRGEVVGYSASVNQHPQWGTYHRKSTRVYWKTPHTTPVPRSAGSAVAINNLGEMVSGPSLMRFLHNPAGEGP